MNDLLTRAAVSAHMRAWSTRRFLAARTNNDSGIDGNILLIAVIAGIIVLLLVVFGPALLDIIRDAGDCADGVSNLAKTTTAIC